MPAMCHKRRCELFLIVADTANLISNLRIQGNLLQRLVCARARPPVGGLFYRSFGGILHNRFTERSTALALNVSQLFAPIPIRCRRYDAVRGVSAPHVEVSILEAVLALVEHFQRLPLASGIAAMDCIHQVEMLDHCRKVVGIMIEIVSVPDLRRATMSPPVMRDYSVAPV